MVDVPDGAHIDMRLGALEFLLTHLCFLTSLDRLDRARTCAHNEKAPIGSLESKSTT
jgi:hypothetical protein